MKVRVCYTVDVGDEYRRAVRHYHGGEGLASRQEIKDWFLAHGMTMDDDVMAEYYADLEREPAC